MALLPLLQGLIRNLLKGRSGWSLRYQNHWSMPPFVEIWKLKQFTVCKSIPGICQARIWRTAQYRIMWLKLFINVAIKTLIVLVASRSVPKKRMPSFPRQRDNKQGAGVFFFFFFFGFCGEATKTLWNPLNLFIVWQISLERDVQPKASH